MKRVPGILAVALAIAAIMFAVAGMVSFESLRGWGTSVRSADDVTPERYLRWVQTCRFFAIVFFLFAGLTWYYRTTVSQFLLRLRDNESTTDTARGLSGTAIPAIVVCAAAFGLRLANLFQPMAYDESYTYVNFASRSLPEAIGDYNSTNNHLFNTFCIYVTTRVFGAEEWAIRLPAFICGCLLPWAVIVWAGEWISPRVALVAAAFTAVSPELITYSVDARGYMYVVLAAIVLDLSLARLHRSVRPRPWIMAWLAVVIGLCAMPIMLYAVIASTGWFLILPPARQTVVVSRRQRVVQSATLLTTAAVAVLLFYTPAYIFRGLLFLKDPIMQSADHSSFLSRLAVSWNGGFTWWTDGALPWFGWIAVLLCGLFRAERSAAFLVRWSAPFVVMLAINLLQQLAPPPRIYMHLAPWIFLLAGIGLVGTSLRANVPRWRPAQIIAVVVLITGTALVWQRSTLFFPEERTGYASVPDVIERLQHEVSLAPDVPHLLLAPLPTDLPAVFYMDRRGFRVPMNQAPVDGQYVWLMAGLEQQPQDVLSSGLIQLADHADQFHDWQLVARYDTLCFYRSQYHSAAETDQHDGK